MRKTRILVVSGFSAFFKQGGGEVEAASLRHALQDQGFDVQISGYGLSTKYHADNEAASLSALQKATRIISTVSE
jgi:hypothetical protein